jgi:dTDP-4-dehydrorhamnose 3,5-epimerase
MQVTATPLQDCFILQPNIFTDERGYFIESFNAHTFFEKTGLLVNFVQDNESKSNKNVVRGLHCQTGAFAQAKLVRVVKGAVLDVAVDMRKDSPTYLQHVAVELTEENKTQLFVPRGFVHGFVVLQDDTIFSYKCDNYYNKESDAGILWSDSSLAIDWRIDPSQAIVSAKDVLLPSVDQSNL